MVLAVFKSFFYNIRDLWRVSNSVFQAVVKELFCLGADELK